MPQPYPDPANFTGLGSVIRYSNTVTDSAMTILFSAACFIVLFLLCKAKFQRTSDSFFISSLLTLVLSSFLWAADLLAGKYLVIYLLAAVASLIWSMFDKSY